MKWVECKESKESKLRKKGVKYKGSKESKIKNQRSLILRHK